MMGCIELYRELSQWEWFNKSEMVHLFIYFLGQANTESKTQQDLQIPRGSFITSLRKISADTGLSLKTVRTCLKRFQKAQDGAQKVAQETAQRFTVITICDYDRYTVDKMQGDTTMGTTNGTEMGTVEEKERKKEKEVFPPIPPLQEKEINKEKEEIRDVTVVTSLSPSQKNEGSQATPLSGTSPDADAVNSSRQNFISWFNRMVDEHNSVISKIQCIKNQRLQMFNARLKEYGKAKMVQAVVNMLTSDFLNCRGDKPFTASIDWMLKPNNFVKVLEGNYGNRQFKPQRKEKSKLEHNMELLAIFKTPEQHGSDYQSEGYNTRQISGVLD